MTQPAPRPPLKPAALIPAPIAALIVTATVAMALLAWQRHESFHPFNQDFTSLLQSLWNAVQHGTFDESIYHNQTLFHGHFCPVLLLTLPAVFCGRELFPLTLIIIQCAMVGLSALPVYLLARARLGSFAGTAVVATYLGYPALQFATMFQVVPLLFGLPFLTWACYTLIVHRNHRGFALAMLTALICQEVYWYTAFIGGLLLLRRQAYRHAAFLLVVSPLLFAGLLVFFFPAVKSNPLLKDSREISTWWYGYLSAAPTAASALTAAARELLSPLTAAYAGRLLLPLLLVPLAAPSFAAAAALTVLPYCFAAFPFPRQIYAYYVIIVLPFLFTALVEGLRALGQRVHWRGRPAVQPLALLVLGATFAAACLESPFMPQRRPFAYFPEIYTNDRAGAINSAIASIPVTARVLTTASLSEKLFPCRQLDVIFLGNILELDYDYLLVDLQQFNWILDIERPFAPVFFHELRRQLLARHWHIARHEAGILLLQRAPAGDGQFPDPALLSELAQAVQRSVREAGLAADEPVLYRGLASCPTRNDHLSHNSTRLPFAFFDPAGREDATYTVSADTRLLAAGRLTATTPLTLSPAALPEGRHDIVLRVRIGAWADSAELAYTVDRTPPQLQVTRMPGRWPALVLAITATDTLSPVEVFCRDGAETRWLTHPLFREWSTAENTLNIYHPFPGGSPACNARFRLWRSGPARLLTFIARDRAGNASRVDYPVGR